MIHLIEPGNYIHYRDDLNQMYELRHHIFYENLKWEVNSIDGKEKDEYDENNTYYLIYKDNSGIVKGCLRLIEMTNSCMFDGPFNDALPDLQQFKKSGYWEISRMAIDDEPYNNTSFQETKKITMHLFIALMLFGLELQKVKFYLFIAFPDYVKSFENYDLIINLINKTSWQNDQLGVFSLECADHTYKNLLNKSALKIQEIVLLSNYY